MLKDEIIVVGDQRWKVREAKSYGDAMNEIIEARATGSVGSRCVLNETLVGGGMTVIADVVQINSDGSERKPYTEAY